MTAVKRVELVLENCESIVFNRQNLNGFNLYGYSTNLGMNGKWQSCAGFIMTVDGYSKEGSCINSDGCMLERLQRYQDVTCIKIKFENGTSEDVYPIWPEDDKSQGQKHEYQSVSIIKVKDQVLAVISQDMGLLSPGCANDLEYALADAKHSLEFIA